MLASPKALWDNSLLFIKDNVSEQQYNTWFRPIVFILLLRNIILYEQKTIVPKRLWTC